MKNWLNFGSHPLPDPDPEIFRSILQHCEIGDFSTIWLISPERVIEVSWIFLSQTYPWTRKFPLNFGSYRTPDPGHILLAGRMRSHTARVILLLFLKAARRFIYYTTRECGLLLFSVESACVSLCLYNALTFECMPLTQKAHACRLQVRLQNIYGHVRTYKVIGQGYMVARAKQSVCVRGCPVFYSMQSYSLCST